MKEVFALDSLTKMKGVARSKKKINLIRRATVSIKVWWTARPRMVTVQNPSK